MGTNILPGQALVGGQANGQLNQYYGLADTTATTVTSATFANLSTLYTIPAGEATAASAYELCCGGSGTWGSTVQALSIDVKLNSNSLHSARQLPSSEFAASTPVAWSACLKIICADGVSLWQGSWSLIMNQTANPVSFSVAYGDSSTAGVTAAVSSAITVVFQAAWASTTGAPTITNSWTTFRKVS